MSYRFEPYPNGYRLICVITIATLLLLMVFNYQWWETLAVIALMTATYYLTKLREEWL